MQVETEKLALDIRVGILDMIYKSGASHIGSAFSIVDVLAVLYGDVLNFRSDEPDWEARDRFILSKGHAAAALYTTLAEVGYFSEELLASYSHAGSILLGHSSHHVPGVEFSTGSLGHGLPVGLGMALASKSSVQPYRVFVGLGDGEMDEGSNWEAFMFAAHLRLGNLVAIVDYNKIQSYGTVDEIMSLEPLKSKLESFGWAVDEVDGHDHTELKQVLSKNTVHSVQPQAVIAHTVKGKGVGFMENNLAWHYKNPNDEQYQIAMKELTGQ